jgi:integrase
MAQIDRKKVKLLEGDKTPKNKKLAAERLHAILRLRHANPEPDSGRHTVASVIDLYISHAGSSYSERSLYERKLILQSFAELHGWRKVNDRDCLPYHITEWLAAHPEWKSDWTKASAVNVIQRPFNWAVDERLIPANPFRGKTHRPGEPRRPLTNGEFQALLRAASVWLKRQRLKNPHPSDVMRRKRPSAGARFRHLLIFLRFTGARPGEASHVEWTDIDLEKAVIILYKHKTSRTQRDKKPRIIPLHPVVLKLLIYIRRLGQPGQRVFLTHRKTPWNRSNLSLRVRRTRKVAGIPDDAKLYGLRHAFGTRAIVNHLDLKTLAELMGHTTTRMTEHYVHLAGQQTHLAAAMLRVNAQNPGF